MKKLDYNACTVLTLSTHRLYNIRPTLMPKADRLNIRLTEQHKNRLTKIVKTKGSTATQTNVIEELIDKEYRRLKSLATKKQREK